MSRARLLTDFWIGLVTDPSVFDGKDITLGGLTRTVDTGGCSSSDAAGTRRYLAPEILEGRPATRRSDLYALGVVLYQKRGVAGASSAD